jgi:alpha-tubulin suppressor-like RCC1 family protein
MFGVGNNVFGCLADDKVDCYSNIKQIGFFSNSIIVDVACGFNHCLSISNKGEVFGWGNSQYYQIGVTENNIRQSLPIKIFKI